LHFLLVLSAITAALSAALSVLRVLSAGLI
jgi:hypothetical protein